MAKKKQDPLKLLLEQHDAPAPFLSWSLDYLKYYGYLKGDPTPDRVKDAARDFQVNAGIDADGVIGSQTLETMWLPRCGLRDDAFTEAARWRQKDLTYYVEQYLEGVPGLSRQDQDDLQSLCFRDYESKVDVRWTRVGSRNQANLVIGVGEGRGDGFDGPGGVLAWCQIPNGSISQIQLKFDRSDTWVKSLSAGQRGILYPNVMDHELGHGHGLLHINGPTALMNPIYNPAVGKLLTPDVDALLAMGYPRATTPPLPPPGQTRGKITLLFEAGELPNFECFKGTVGAVEAEQVRIVTE